MFPEFGLAPLCLELDLDSYEGSWTHVAAFRGRSGWLMAARATIQSEHDLMRSVLLAACDDYENPIPAWRAAHLVTCDWSNLEECRELPPDLLDDLLCEEEGAFFARWQREANGELVALHERAQHDLAVLDTRAAAIQRQADHEIAELQRRRRRPDATPDTRSTLGQLIAQIESGGDAAVSEALSQRAALRREIDAAEEALWHRADVLVEVEPMWCVHWQATALRRPASPPARPVWWQETKGAGLSSVELANSRLLRAMRAARLAVREAPIEAPAPLQPVVRRVVNDPAVTLRQARQEMGQHYRERVAVIESPRPATAARGSALPVATTTPVLVAEVLPVANVPALHDPLEKLRAERRALQLRLAEAVKHGSRFLSGSPKFRRNREDQSALRSRIAVLDALLGDTEPLPPVPRTAPPERPRIDLLEADRADLAAKLAAHERRGAARADGRRRFILYAARRAEITARLKRLDAQLAHARAQAKEPA